MKKIQLLLFSSFFCVVSLISQNYALQFNAINQYVDINANASESIWTIEFWVKKTAHANQSALLTGETTKVNLETYATAGNVGITKNGNADFNFNYSLPINKWEHVAIVCNGRSTHLLINGILKDTVNAFMKVPMKTINSVTDGSIAIVDELRVWNTAKRPVDIRLNMNHSIDENSIGLIGYWKFDDRATSATDYSKSGYRGKIHGALYVSNDNDLFNYHGAEMKLISATSVFENDFYTKQGAENQELICVKVNTRGNKNPLKITNLNISTIGTTDLKDLQNLKVFFTGHESTFSTQCLSAETDKLYGNMEIALDQVLIPGENYFWITCDVSKTAKQKHKICIKGISVNVNNLVTPLENSTKNFGCRQIYNFNKKSSNIISVIPKPVSVVEMSGLFKLLKTIKIITHNTLSIESQYLADILRRATGYKIPVLSQGSQRNNIVLEINKIPDSIIGDEGYCLEICSDGVKLTANSSAGIFYGIQTFRQLLPLEINNKTKNTDIIWTCPNIKITDYPRFKWRGFMLDVSRHFFPVSDIKRYIDICAMNKLNVFHWHIMDDQGFRLETKSHPELNSIGSARPHCTKDNDKYDNGYYTQEEVREIVKYAKERHIEIMPELETPGHTASWLASLPGMSCTSVEKGTQRVACMHSGNNNLPVTICVGKNYSYKVIGDVIEEMTSLFPCKYVHIGGDEVVTTPWKTCTDCLKLMNDSSTVSLPLDTNHLHNLQTFYLRKIDRILSSKGKKVVGWSEMGLLSPNSVLQDYMGGVARKIIDKGQEVIYSEAAGLYLDSYQCGINEPKVNSWMGHITLEKVYKYNPPVSALPEDKKRLIMGVEACLWSENNNDTTIVEYRMLPRLYAVAETAWTAEKNKNFSDFNVRLHNRVGELNLLGYHYCPLKIPEPLAETKVIKTNQSEVILNAGFAADCYFWNDYKKSNTYSISVTKSGIYKVYGLVNQTLIQRVFDIGFEQKN